MADRHPVILCAQMTSLNDMRQQSTKVFDVCRHYNRDTLMKDNHNDQ